MNELELILVTVARHGLLTEWANMPVEYVLRNYPKLLEWERLTGRPS